MGCSAVPVAGLLSTSYLINERILLDAGAVSSALDIEEQVRVDHILLSHAHLDHIQGIATLADNVVGARKEPVTIHATKETWDSVKAHFLNNVVWPDFTAIPTPANPVLRFSEIEPGIGFDIGPLTVEAVPVKHSVPTVGFILDDGRSALAYTSDTGQTQLFWKRVARHPNLEALIIHCALPNRLSEEARAAGHLTPAALSEELGKFARPAAKIFIGHIKSKYAEELTDEIYALAGRKIGILEEGDAMEFGEEEPKKKKPAVVTTRYEEHDFLIETASREKRREVFHRFGRVYRAGEIIFEEGDDGDEMFIIHEGKVKIWKIVRNKKKVLETLGGGDFFGEMAILNAKPRSATAETIEDVKLLVFSRQTFEKLVRNNAGIATRLIKALASRLQTADDHIENLLYKDVESQVINTLIKLMADYGIPEGNRFRLSITPKDLAEKLGLDVKQVKLVVKSLKEKRIIELRKDGILLPPPEKLEKALDYLALKEEFGF